MRRIRITTKSATATIIIPLAIFTSAVRSLSYSIVRNNPFASNFQPSKVPLNRVFFASVIRAGMSTQPPTQIQPTPRVLSIQSHTVHGFVGNKAATFPLQTMGFDVNAINTITLSNHPAYSKGTKGQSLDANVLKEIFTGLEDNSLLNYDVIMTGYTRFPAHLEHIAAAVTHIREVNPKAIYVCDPVLGDNEQYYVPPDLKAKYEELLLPLATVITPNIFECEVLSGLKITSQAEAIKAAKKLHALGPTLVMMTGLPIVPSEEYDTPHLSIILSYNSKRVSSPDEPLVFKIDVPKLEGYYAGCGDLFSGLTASAIANLKDNYEENPFLLGTALELVAEAMSEVLNLTKFRSSRELCVVESRDIFINIQDKLQQLKVASPNSIDFYQSIESAPPRLRSILINHPKVLGIIFDMDGTLTEPGAIDFQAMYDRIGIARTKDSDILTLVNKLPTEAERSRALEIIYDEEMRGIQRQVIRSEVQKVIYRLHDAKLRLALCTRNCKDAYLQFLAQSKIHSHYFLPALFRESTNPSLQKPNPALAHHILSSWKIQSPLLNAVEKGLEVNKADETNKYYWFVGDSIDDMKCGKLAGLTTVLIKTDYNQDLPSQNPELVDHYIHTLDELLPLLNIANHE